MKCTILTVGKKNEPWVNPGVFRFLERLRPPFDAEMVILSHSSAEASRAITEESGTILGRIKTDDFMILLDENGKNISSPELSEIIEKRAQQHIVFVIGGAYGVSSEVKQRANFCWSLSKLVFPHQLVRLILAEQIYRAQEIYRGGKYHHQ